MALPRLSAVMIGQREAGQAMSEMEYDHKLDELDRLLNDPDVPMEPERVWSLLAEIAGRDLGGRQGSGAAA